jgi:hypothetical protein
MRPALVLAAAVTAALAGTAAAARADNSISSNWSGYAATGTTASGAPTTFGVVAGSWVQPAVTCEAGRATWSSFWVGLGGFGEGSQALEQIGTDADCTAEGQPVYRVWYELVPDYAVHVRLRVDAGDHLSAVVVVHGTQVIVRLRNLTRDTVFTRKVTASVLDLTSAEWIAEAPSNCDGSGCSILPLANFGTVTFTGAAAVGDGRAAPLASWTVTPIELVAGDRLTRAPTGSGALPSPVGADGGSFSIAYTDELPAP